MKSIGSLLILSLPIAILLAIETGCSDGNIYERYEEKDALAIAQNKMEKGDYKGAQLTLEKFVTQNANRGDARSLLAASYAAQAGVTIKQFVLNGLSSSDKKTEEGSNLIAESVPELTSSTDTLMAQALGQMALISPLEKTKEMNLQEGLFGFIYVFMKLKYLKANPQALASLTIQDAESLLASLSGATVLIANVSGNSGLATKIQESTNAITQKEGSNAAEKISKYIQSNSSN